MACDFARHGTSKGVRLRNHSAGCDTPPASCWRDNDLDAIRSVVSCACSQRQCSSRAPVVFWVLFGGQTGSTHLAQDFLARHPQIAWVGEGQNGCTLELARRAHEHGVAGGIRAIGTKTQFVSEGCYQQFLAVAPRTRIVHITRRNSIAWGLSDLRKGELRKRGLLQCTRASAHANCSAAKQAPLRVDVHKLKQLVARKVREERRRVQGISSAVGGHALLSIAYEDMLADEAVYVARVLRFVGVASTPNASGGASGGGSDATRRYVKLSRPRLRDNFANWPEVVAAFCGTPFERHLGLAADEWCPAGGSRPKLRERRGAQLQRA